MKLSIYFPGLSLEQEGEIELDALVDDSRVDAACVDAKKRD